MPPRQLNIEPVSPAKRLPEPTPQLTPNQYLQPDFTLTQYPVYLHPTTASTTTYGISSSYFTPSILCNPIYLFNKNTFNPIHFTPRNDSQQFAPHLFAQQGMSLAPHLFSQQGMTQQQFLSTCMYLLNKE
ncbi:hypothetical protein TNIN_179391 [Trichonephila inaurata madagascariensis]|uniref:Uncharacterized protein n=1 Tax=Trichonephila inaurata madagascariensis TaxID=2747483 RepID=A0A8X6Y6C6_9ARAC|nr:hypothetical protein TNIN_179391 [Trichonephila inaurata madagascariensis]